MMKYFLDTEFHEYHKQIKVASVKVGKPIPTIDLISIGIVAEDGREYYAVSKDFNIEDAWNSYQLEEFNLNALNGEETNSLITKNYWLRNNVLKNLFNNSFYKNYSDINTIYELKRLVTHFGKTNKQISEEIHAFIYKEYLDETGLKYPEAFNYSNPNYDPKFYGYYADYDWVVFAQLFGKMINLPKGFPMYCKDLKQIYDSKNSNQLHIIDTATLTMPIEDYVKTITKTELKRDLNYPKQSNEHNALADTKWNYELYKFLLKQ